MPCLDGQPGVFRYVGNKTFDSSSKNQDFLPKNNQIWPEIGIFVHFGPGLDGSFGVLLVDWLEVVARGLYLARHLFTLFLTQICQNLLQLLQGFDRIVKWICQKYICISHPFAYDAESDQGFRLLFTNKGVDASQSALCLRSTVLMVALFYKSA